MYPAIRFYLVIFSMAIVVPALGLKEMKYGITTKKPFSLNQTPLKGDVACTTSSGAPGKCILWIYCNDKHETEPGGIYWESEYRSLKCPLQEQWCCSTKNITIVPQEPTEPTITYKTCTTLHNGAGVCVPQTMCNSVDTDNIQDITAYFRMYDDCSLVAQEWCCPKENVTLADATKIPMNDPQPMNTTQDDTDPPEKNLPTVNNPQSVNTEPPFNNLPPVSTVNNEPLLNNLPPVNKRSPANNLPPPVNKGPPVNNLPPPVTQRPPVNKGPPVNNLPPPVTQRPHVKKGPPVNNLAPPVTQRPPVNKGPPFNNLTPPVTQRPHVNKGPPVNNLPPPVNNLSPMNIELPINSEANMNIAPAIIYRTMMMNIQLMYSESSGQNQ